MKVSLFEISYKKNELFHHIHFFEMYLYIKSKLYFVYYQEFIIKKNVHTASTAIHWNIFLKTISTGILTYINLIFTQTTQKKRTET